MAKVKTASDYAREQKAAARDLPVEVKRKFWGAMTKDGKTLGEARRIAGIEDVCVAAELAIQCHTEIHVPMDVEDIT